MNSFIIQCLEGKYILPNAELKFGENINFRVGFLVKKNTFYRYIILTFLLFLPEQHEKENK